MVSAECRSATRTGLQIRSTGGPRFLGASPVGRVQDIESVPPPSRVHLTPRIRGVCKEQAFMEDTLQDGGSGPPESRRADARDRQMAETTWQDDGR